jgi:PAS domain S-box-containing protein
MPQRDAGRRKQSALRGSTDFLQSVIDGIPESLVVIDLDYRILLANRAVRELSGWQDPVSGRLTCHRVLHGSPTPCEGPEHFCTLEEVVRKKAPVTVTHTHVDSRGREALVEIVAAPIFDEAGEVTQIVESGRDVSERIRAEEARRRLEARMREVQNLESLAVLAGGIAHDFNNLLAVIIGNTDVLCSELPPDSRTHESVNEIEAAAQRAAHLVRQMMEFSGRNRFVVLPLDLNEPVKEMVELLKSSLARGVVVECDLPDRLPSIEADPTQIPRLVMNLITNASEAIRDENGVISIGTGSIDCDRAYLGQTYLGEDLPEGVYVYLDVVDDGCGMDEETRQRIFEPFFTTKFVGRGLGMAAALGIVRGHAGTVEVSSEVGAGTKVRVLFPTLETRAGSIS